MVKHELCDQPRWRASNKKHDEENVRRGLIGERGIGKKRNTFEEDGRSRHGSRATIQILLQTSALANQSNETPGTNHFSVRMIFWLTVQIRLSNYLILWVLLWSRVSKLRVRFARDICCRVIYHLAQRDLNTNHLSVAMDTLCTPTNIYIYIHHIHGLITRQSN